MYSVSSVGRSVCSVVETHTAGKRPASGRLTRSMWRHEDTERGFDVGLRTDSSPIRFILHPSTPGGSRSRATYLIHLHRLSTSPCLRMLRVNRPEANRSRHMGEGLHSLGRAGARPSIYRLSPSGTRGLTEHGRDKPLPYPTRMNPIQNNTCCRRNPDNPIFKLPK